MPNDVEDPSDCPVRDVTIGVLHERVAGLRAMLLERIRTAEIATSIAAKDIDRRLESMNAFRDQLNHERTSYLSRELYDRESQTLSDKVSDIELEYMKRDMYDREHGVLADRVTSIEKNYVRLDNHEPQHTELQRRLSVLELANSEQGGWKIAEAALRAQRNWSIGVAVAVITSLIAIAIHYFSR